MEIPEEDLLELASILDSGGVKQLRERFDHPRRVRQRLSQFTERIFMFPFGVHPDPTKPIDIYYNGMLQWTGEEVVLRRVGTVEPLTVLVLDHPASTKDTVEAIYTTMAQAEP